MLTQRNTTALKGLEHIRALEERFPRMPKSIIIKTDLLRAGIKYTPLLNYYLGKSWRGVQIFPLPPGEAR